MHWISLSAAAIGRARDATHDDVLLLARAGVEAGNISFPLSITHYQETANRRDWASRRDLASIMIELSDLHSIAAQNTLIRAEITNAVEHYFGVDIGAQSPHPFGRGLAHVLGHSIPAYQPPKEVADRLPPGALWQLQREYERRVERTSLAGLPPSSEERIREAHPGWDPTAHVAVGVRAAQEQEEARGRRQAAGFNKGKNAKNYFAFEAFDEWLDEFGAALARGGIPPDSLPKIGAERMTDLLRIVPTLWAGAEFRRHRSTSSQAVLVGNDLMDQQALPQAVVYCDVVVTERQHAAAFHKLQLDAAHGTTVLYDLSDLIEHLL